MAAVKGARGAAAFVVGGAVTAGLVGCASSAQERPGLTASPTVSPTTTTSAEQVEPADAEPEGLDAYYRYWGRHGHGGR